MEADDIALIGVGGPGSRKIGRDIVVSRLSDRRGGDEQVVDSQGVKDRVIHAVDGDGVAGVGQVVVEVAVVGGVVGFEHPVHVAVDVDLQGQVDGAERG